MWLNLSSVRKIMIGFAQKIENSKGLSSCGLEVHYNQKNSAAASVALFDSIDSLLPSFSQIQVSRHAASYLAEILNLQSNIAVLWCVLRQWTDADIIDRTSRSFQSFEVLRNSDAAFQNKSNKNDSSLRNADENTKNQLLRSYYARNHHHLLPRYQFAPHVLQTHLSTSKPRQTSSHPRTSRRYMLASLSIGRPDAYVVLFLNAPLSLLFPSPSIPRFLPRI